MDKKQKVQIVFLIILFIFVFWWALFSPKPDVSVLMEKTIQEQKKQADLFFKDVTFKEVQNGVKYWELHAKESSMNKSNGRVLLNQTDGLFFENGKPVLKFLSPQALWEMNKKDIYLEEPIGFDLKSEKKIMALLKKIKKFDLSLFTLPDVSARQRGYWFRAHNLLWRLSDKKIRCSKGIYLTKGDVSAYAKRLTADTALKRVVLDGNPKIIIIPEKNQNNGTIEVVSKKFIIDSINDTVIADGKSVITWKKARVLADKLKYLQKDEELILSGSVKASQGDVVVSGKEAYYKVVQQKIIFKGDVFARSGKNELKGSEITLSLRDNKLSVKGQTRIKVTEEEFD